MVEFSIKNDSDANISIQNNYLSDVFICKRTDFVSRFFPSRKQEVKALLPTGVA